MHKSQPTVAMDFSVHAFDVAVGMLETTPNLVEILVPASLSVTAYQLQQQYGCKVTYLPPELLKSQFVWAVRTTSALVWSPGIG